MIGAHPCDALQLIDELQLYPAIFTDPTQETLQVPDTSRWHIAYNCLDSLIQDSSSDLIAQRLIVDSDATYLAWNLAALTPWMVVVEPPNPQRKANALPLIAIVSREGFKAPNKLSDIIAASYRNRGHILSLKRAVCEGATFTNERDRFGMAIRKWDTPAGSWKLQVLNALLVEATEIFSTWSDTASEGKDL